MKNILLFAAFFSVLFIVSCNKDDDDDSIDYQYHAHIQSPNTDDKHVGDSIDIVVEFESHTSETIHHINVKIYNKADESIVILDEPATAHVHAQTGMYEYRKENFELSNANGVTEHTDWILEAKVWAEAEGEAEVVETVEFHVHP